MDRAVEVLTLKRTLQQISMALLSFLSASFLASYLQWEPAPLVRLILFLLILIASLKICRGLQKKSLRVRKAEFGAFFGFSFLLSVSLILGFHIVIGDGYSGTMVDNYIVPYTWWDALSFLFILYGVCILALAAYLLLKSRMGMGSKTQKSMDDDHECDSLSYRALQPVDFKWIAISSAFIFVLWLPYFLTYFPGLIMNDSLSSIRQATGESVWDNHFPAAYTFIIFCCIKFASIFGLGLNAGCAIYSLVQMALMSLCFGYLCSWVTRRCDFSRIWLFALTVYFALTPYIASYSIAMWKDPLFSAAIVMLTVLLMDCVLSKGEVVVANKSWLVLFTISLVAMSLLRSNGIYICVLVCLALAIVWVVGRKRKFSSGWLRAFVSSVMVAAFALCLTGPIYNAIGVTQAPKAESVGVLINQMARVAATDGDMTEDDREYLDELFPLEKYKEEYRPCCTDLLKWHPEFNNAALEEGLISHWMAMLLRNPAIYFESWELETCGYWAINQTAVLANINNLIGGVPNELEAGAAVENNPILNFFDRDSFKEMLPIDEWNIPLSLINWFLVYISICLVFLNRKSWVLSLVPMFGLILTLLVASPLYYWARYEVAGHFLIPFYVALIVFMIGPHKDRLIDPC